jgi:hypothetical protein
MPIAIPQGVAGDVCEAVDGTCPMYDVLARLGLPSEGEELRRLRTTLATTQFPYLQACDPE